MVGVAGGSCCSGVAGVISIVASRCSWCSG